MPTVHIIIAALLWGSILFAVAQFGERRPWVFERYGHIIYPLSLAVYCTSWTFYGMVTQATAYGWLLPPTFFGTMAMFVLGFPFIQRLCRYAREHNATSIADLIGSRFDQNSRLAAIVTGVAALGIIPYIALQLRAVAQTYELLTATKGADPVAWKDAAFWIALLMAAFAMLFGTRHVAATEHNRGLVLAMSFESIFKLICFFAVGIYAIWITQFDLSMPWPTPPELNTSLTGDSYLALVILGILALFTLPHQVQITIIEFTSPKHLRTARWLFPLYLLLISLPILALAWVHQHSTQGSLPADFYSLSLPLSHGNRGVALIVFLGGLSAATGMVIMAAVTLSVMVGNHWITPLLLRKTSLTTSGGNLRRTLLLLRRTVIAFILLLAWWYSRQLGNKGILTDLGAVSVSVSVLIHLAPGVITAVYNLQVGSRAISRGLFVGVLLWAYLLLLPIASRVGLFDSALLNHLGNFSPEHFFGLGGLDPLTRSLLVSLSANALTVLIFSRRQNQDILSLPAAITAENLRSLASRFLTPAQLERVLEENTTQSPDSSAQTAAIEHELSSILGVASARLLLDTARRSGKMEAVANFVGEASAAVHFSQTLLEVALENMSQGISVVDRDLRLLAWNQRYADLFQYPDDLLKVGTPIELLVRQNAERGLLGSGSIEDLITRRIAHLRAGTSYVAERVFPDGSVVEIRGNPMPGGGFVATFTDVSASRRTEYELKRLNETLEQRVIVRTAESEMARLEAEHANRGKSRFLAAIGHDLLQPINAAHLFTHTLGQQLKGSAHHDVVMQIDGALTSTESLVSALLDISRLDAGGFVPRITRFPADELLKNLSSEFSALAGEKNIKFKYIPTKAWIESDPQLLRRVLQNFLSNAVRYTEKGCILLGVRRLKDALRIEVHDTGPGIAEADRTLIFEEFKRLDRPGGSEGLGLGLAIADRIARLLKTSVLLRSQLKKGTVFSIEVPRVKAPPIVGIPESTRPTDLPQSTVLVVENDIIVQGAMRALLESWNCEVLIATNAREAEKILQQTRPDLAILDYHLDAEETGLSVRQALGNLFNQIPCVIITADRSDATRDAVAKAGCFLLHKPLKPLALKSLMSRLFITRHNVL
jgi:signal transduction histidine kinase/Na+/proline symporter/CheY-like chemotaxis protein